eukprot:Plantae.Rhodophyta-Hildenbrandia_rubra.ctg3285.p1 GENE.Plantae.Rhodophyta-Hildenbrandia_rubra.ctg3285~~Plantae.Rhodophyta-Hildenbrandia_rubra.ctg3285.p1  ORF type:complete len:668 (-),score=95.21 Plantae.Rhodophyta-Hildenbrandia_rubra.ctg3285:2390-4393(-)
MYAAPQGGSGPRPAPVRPEYSPDKILMTAGGKGGNPFAQRGTKVDLRVKGIGLTGASGRAPDSFVVMYVRVSGRSDWKEVTRSETIDYNADPDYFRIFQVDYQFELYQEIRVVVFERSGPSDNLSHHSLIGIADCTLGSIVSARGASLTKTLVNVQSNLTSPGSISISAEEVISAKKDVELEMNVSWIMDESEREEQIRHIEQLQQQLEPPAPEKRGGVVGLQSVKGAVKRFQKFRKSGDKGPTVLPAQLENQVVVEEQKADEIKQQIQKIQSNPPPFVPFLTISRASSSSATMDPTSADIRWEIVYKSEMIFDYKSNDVGAKLPTIKLTQYELNEGDDSRPIQISVYRTHPTEGQMLLGCMETSLLALRTLNEGADFTLRPSGRLTIGKYKESVSESFLDYVRGGWCDFSLMCAVDFTSSNGSPKQQGTLHYNPPPGTAAMPNEYEAAMRAVGNILSNYSSDQRIPAYGFGANLPPEWKISHCFAMTGNPWNPFCEGVEGLIVAYKNTLNSVQLFGPTIFSEVLRTAGTIVSRRTEAAVQAGNTSLAYTVLLILTDGVISDFDTTVAELIKLSELPLSLIVIGIGKEDFRKMKELEGSRKPLQRGNVFAKRNIVQFVPFREFGGDLSVLAERVLSEIPTQVLSYVKLRGQTAPSVPNRNQGTGTTY